MDKPYVIGIDIGGTNSVFGVVDTRGNVLYNGSIKTGKYEDVTTMSVRWAKGYRP